MCSSAIKRTKNFRLPHHEQLLDNKAHECISLGPMTPTEIYLFIISETLRKLKRACHFDIYYHDGKIFYIFRLCISIDIADRYAKMLSEHFHTKRATASMSSDTCTHWLRGFISMLTSLASQPFKYDKISTYALIVIDECIIMPDVRR